MLRILQVCNVGQIVGGTTACAWTVTRSLPEFEHTVAFLQPVSQETREAFAHCRIARWDRVTRSHVRAADPDLVLLHNTPPGRVETPLPAPCIQYVHSRITPAAADVTLCCSRWLATQLDRNDSHVCRQAVPVPPRPSSSAETRSLRETPVIGRLCTPSRRKWPSEIVPLYRSLAERFPQVRWEFVGCPSELQDALRFACQGRSAFLPASWSMRSRLWQWDALLYHHPTLTESFGRTVAEAMRAGCIPIVDNRGGFTEQVTDQCGFLCGEPDDFVAGVERILDSGQRLRMSRACRAHADEHFPLARFRRDLLQWFRQAVGAAPVPA